MPARALWPRAEAIKTGCLRWSLGTCAGFDHTPPMDTLDYWTPADALAFRCSVEQVGTLRPLSTEPVAQVSTLRPDVAEARLYAQRAMRALARIMESGESRASLEAAREILLRAYGPALQPEPPPSAPPPTDQPDPRVLPAPDWLDMNSRLGYGAQLDNAPRHDD